MSLTKNQKQLEVLKHGLNLLYFWCTNQRLEEAIPLVIDECLKLTSKKLCCSDIFTEDFCFPSTQLKSIFSDICIPPGGTSKVRSLNALPLREDKIPFYDSPAGEDWKTKAAEEISQSYETIRENPTALLILLEKYGSFIPIASNKHYNSISLYEHIKFLSCLADAGTGDKPHLLVSADFSGIQDFIYTISSKGALKSLRARSFFLELLANHIIYEILDTASATPANIIYAGGGGFALLLANRDETKESLKELKREFNEWLLNKHQGKMYLGMQWMELKPEEVCAPQFKDTWFRMGELLEADKQLKFGEALPALLKVAEPQLAGDEECQICHRDDLNKSEMKSISDLSTGEKMNACPLCYRLFQWGDDLTDYKYVIRQSWPSDHSIELPSLNGPTYYRIPSKQEKVESFEMRWVKNNWDVIEYADGRSALLLCADYVTKKSDLNSLQPDESDSTADFELLAKNSTGKKLIGALRMDVDNLGLLFTQGIAGDRFDLAHYSALSRQLSLFFTVYMNLLCRARSEKPLDLMGKKPWGNHGRNVTIVYSGGDDLFIVGAWDEVAELACDIAQNFARYGGHSPDISISGGVFLAKHDFPLYQIAHFSKRAEEIAKEALPRCQATGCSQSYTDCSLYQDEAGKCARKNAGLLFYVPARVVRKKEKDGKKTEVTTALQWPDIQQKVVPMVKLFCELSKQGVSGHLEVEGISRSFIHQLFQLIDVWESEKELSLPLMHYTVNKLKKTLSGKMVKGDALQKLVSSSYLLKPDLMEVLWVPLTWVDFLMREEK